MANCQKPPFTGKSKEHCSGWTRFASMQNHYNLLYREDERELIPICKQQHVALTPYSPLAAGRVSRLEWNADTKRSQADKTAVSKYDSTKDSDYAIVLRANELAQKYEVTMTQFALARHFAKGVTAPIIGLTKSKYLDDAVGAFNVTLTTEDVAFLDELYVPHAVVGAISLYRGLCSAHHERICPSGAPALPELLFAICHIVPSESKYPAFIFLSFFYCRMETR